MMPPKCLLRTSPMTYFERSKIWQGNRSPFSQATATIGLGTSAPSLYEAASSDTFSLLMVSAWLRLARAMMQARQLMRHSSSAKARPQCTSASVQLYKHTCFTYFNCCSSSCFLGLDIICIPCLHACLGCTLLLQRPLH